MRILQSQEISMISGANSAESFAKVLCAPLFFANGMMMTGGAAGHIAGSITGFKLASRYGLSTTKCYLSGAGLGIIGAVACAYAAVHGGFWLVDQCFGSSKPSNDS